MGLGNTQDKDKPTTHILCIHIRQRQKLPVGCGDFVDVDVHANHQ